MVMFYKTSEDGTIVVDSNGLPVVVDDEKGEEDPEREFGIDAIHLIKKVPALQKEAKDHRLEAKELSEKLKPYEGLNLEEAKKAIELQKNLTAGDLTKKEDVERFKNELEIAWKGKVDELNRNNTLALDEKQRLLDAMEGEIRTALLSTAFAQSPHFSGKEPTTKLPPDIAEKYFGDYFKIEKDEHNSHRKPIGYLKGQVIYSKKRPGEPAEFNEAMDVIIDNYAMKEQILHKSSGSGAVGGGGAPRGRTISRNDPIAIGENLEAIQKGEITVV